MASSVGLMMRVELLNTGSELLLGTVLNSHVRYIADQLFPIGLRLTRQVAVPDGEAIGEAMEEAFGRAEVVIVTGGLGPTSDDITRDLAARLLGVTMHEDPIVLHAITTRMQRRGYVINRAIARQALVPEGAVVLPNHNGTAPGLYFAPHQRPESGLTPHLFLLPGPPRELYPMFEREVLPRMEALGGQDRPSHRSYRIVGLGESKVQELLEDRILALGPVEIGYCARPGEVDLRLIGKASLLEVADGLVRDACEWALVSDDGRTLPEVVLDELRRRGETVGLAESCTGGRIANALTDVPGASGMVKGGVVAYANGVKTGLLGVAPEQIDAHGAVSPEVAGAMAEGACRVLAVDYALSTTGIAGPGGGTPEKPVGTVWIGLAAAGKVVKVVRHDLPADRDTFKHLALQRALMLLLRHWRGA